MLRKIFESTLATVFFLLIVLLVIGAYGLWNWGLINAGNWPFAAFLPAGALIGLIFNWVLRPESTR